MRLSVELTDPLSLKTSMDSNRVTKISYIGALGKILILKFNI